MELLEHNPDKKQIRLGVNGYNYGYIYYDDEYSNEELRYLIKQITLKKLIDPELDVWDLLNDEGFYLF